MEQYIFYRPKKFLSIILSFSLVIASMPLSAEKQLFLAPPGSMILMKSKGKKGEIKAIEYEQYERIISAINMIYGSLGHREESVMKLLADVSYFAVKYVDPNLQGDGDNPYLNTKMSDKDRKILMSVGDKLGFKGIKKNIEKLYEISKDSRITDVKQLINQVKVSLEKLIELEQEVSENMKQISFKNITNEEEIGEIKSIAPLVSQSKTLMQKLYNYIHAREEQAGAGINSVVNDTKAFLAQNYHRAHIVKKLSIIPAPEELVITADPLLLRNILIEYCINADKAKAKNITIATRRDGDDAVIEIRDTGRGIARYLFKEGVLPDRFRMFDMGATSRKSEEGGSGLAFSWWFISDCGGTITVQSEQGKGTIFTIRLPINKTLSPHELGSSSPSAIGRPGRSSFDTLEYMTGKNIYNRQEESYRVTCQRVIDNFGRVELAPEMYKTEFNKILSEKITHLIPNDIIALLNQLKPYDKRWEGYEPPENERSKMFENSYNQELVYTQIKLSISIILTEPKTRFEFIRFPAILFDSHYNYLFGFNSLNYEYLRELFPKPTIGICNELIDYLKYLDEQNNQKGILTHLYLETVVHEALHLTFTHHEARIIARYLFPENYPSDKEIEKSGGLLNKAITTLEVIETIIGYLTRPCRTKWPFDRHAAFGLIGRGMAMHKEDYLAYTPFYKKILKAILLFAFTPNHPDLSRHDIPAWLYYCFGSTDDLTLATLWAMGNLKDFDKSENLNPYLQEGTQGVIYFKELLARRKENTKDDAKRHFTSGERSQILLTSIRYAESIGWSFFPPEVMNYSYIPIKLLPYISDCTNDDLRPILLEFNQLLQRSLYEDTFDKTAQGHPFPDRLDLATAILNSLIKLINFRPEMSLPRDLIATIDTIRTDKRKIVQEKLSELAVKIVKHGESNLEPGINRQGQDILNKSN